MNFCGFLLVRIVFLKNEYQVSTLKNNKNLS